jgi:hypothetical protein
MTCFGYVQPLPAPVVLRAMRNMFLCIQSIMNKVNEIVNMNMQQFSHATKRQSKRIFMQENLKLQTSSYLFIWPQ